jgi:hypothetical protein
MIYLEGNRRLRWAFEDARRNVSKVKLRKEE